jgi:thymidylate synthase
MLAKGSKLKAGQLSCSLGDCHLYNNHLDQAELQLSRHLKDLPIILLNKGITLENNKVTIPQHKDVNISNYKPHPNIKAELSVGT